MVYHSPQAMGHQGRSSSVSAIEVRKLAAAMGCRTQRQLAGRLGITQSRVSQILSGAYPIKPGALLTLVRSLQSQYRQHNRKQSWTGDTGQFLAHGRRRTE